MNKIKMIKHAFDVAKEESYFPEKKRKCLLKRINENIRWIFKYNEYNRFYNLYGMDVKEAKNIFKMGYCDYDKNFRLLREKENRVGDPNSQIYLLRDKFQFYKYLKSVNIATPKVFAFIKNGIVYDENLNKKDLAWLEQFKDYFLKDNNGECGSFVEHIKDGKDLKNLLPFTSNKGEFICQEKAVQNKQFASFNPSSTNTLRLITLRNKDGSLTLLYSILRVGTSKTGNIDNWFKGGLAIGVDEKGHLTKYGFYKPHLGTKTEVHPDTGIVFQDVCLDNFKEIIDFAFRAHECFYGVQSIGWDIAITEKGPTLIEGNDNWEISLVQSQLPLKDKWLSSLK